MSRRFLFLSLSFLFLLHLFRGRKVWIMPKTPPMWKAQGAMEYLATYGWALLMIAITLSILVSLGVFNGSSLNANGCIAVSGYLCRGALYDHTTGNIIATLGQNTGSNWLTANFVFVPAGTAFVAGLPAVSFYSPQANAILTGSGGLPSGIGQAYLYLSATGPVNAGTPISGSIYAYYTFYYYSAGSLQIHSAYTEVGALNLKAA